MATVKKTSGDGDGVQVFVVFLRAVPLPPSGTSAPHTFTWCVRVVTTYFCILEQLAVCACARVRVCACARVRVCVCA